MASQHQRGLRAPPSGGGMRDEMGEDVELEHSCWDGEDEVIASNEGAEEDRKFDLVVGALEEAVMDPGFAAIQQTFMDEWCGAFDDTEENKLVHTNLFQQYTNLVERHLDFWLRERIPDFDMDAFMKMVAEREDEIIGDVFDMLMAVGDFREFKHMMLAHKAGQDCGIAHVGAQVEGTQETTVGQPQKTAP